jgi:hypothetical protein
MTPSIVTKVVVMIFRISESFPAPLQLLVDRRRSESTDGGGRDREPERPSWAQLAKLLRAFALS